MTQALLKKELLNKLEDLLGRAAKAGADSADAILIQSDTTSLECRNDKIENSIRSEKTTVGLRAFVHDQSSIVSSAEFSDEKIGILVERAVETAKMAPADPYAGILPSDAIAGYYNIDLELFDDSEMSIENSFEMAKRAEAAALAVPGVTNSGGSGCNSSRVTVALATSNGFIKAYQSSSFEIGASVVAGDGAEMETDFDARQVRHLADLPDPAEIGKSAGSRAARAVGGRPMKTCRVPVVYDPRVANSLIGHFSNAINGAAVAQGTSFLKEMMGEQIFAPGIQIIDDQTMIRGLGSRPFDAEGRPSSKLELVKDGCLLNWLLDAASARQLGLETTASAQRSPTAPPNPGSCNLYLTRGTATREKLLSDIDYGFYVTGMIGEGINGVTGDYSRGANGFLIEKGKLTKPVKGVTIAGNLRDMFRNLTPANDLEFVHPMNAPSVRINGMTIAGT